MNNQTIPLGSKVKDKLTGFAGIAYGCAYYLTGCDQYLVQPKSSKEGSYTDGKWIDEGRLEIIGEGVKQDAFKANEPGCDATAPLK